MKTKKDSQYEAKFSIWTRIKDQILLLHTLNNMTAVQFLNNASLCLTSHFSEYIHAFHKQKLPSNNSNISHLY